MSKTLRDCSRENWTVKGTVQYEHVNTGAMLRIADACELMSKNYSELIQERNNYKGWYESERERRKHAERVCVSLRGVITRLKKQATETQSAEVK